ncbi:DUF397 domain-containing protein [Streptomyces sp. NPDC002580]|uniref:DUF397 domain-containing protein n=1 Tax=Streptomyces sp. NPDC002580 TaxID=3364653 RepID=UPI00367C958F
MTRETSARVDSGLRWAKSTYSSSSNGNDCVEIAPTPTAIHIRDSKNPGGARLATAPTAWSAFIGFVAQD